MIDPLAKGKQALLVLPISTCFAKAHATEPPFKASSESGDFTWNRPLTAMRPPAGPVSRTEKAPGFHAISASLYPTRPWLSKGRRPLPERISYSPLAMERIGLTFISQYSQGIRDARHP